MPQPRNTRGQFRSASAAIADIVFEPSSEIPEDYSTWLGDGAVVVTFNARGVYRYEGINFIEYSQFKDAPSWGSYFNDYIRPYYSNYERIG